MIGLKQKFVAQPADVRQPPHVLHHGVQLVTVNDENFASVPRPMDGTRQDFNIAEIAGKFGDEFVVVAGNVNQPRALARLAQEFCTTSLWDWGQ